MLNEEINKIKLKVKALSLAKESKIIRRLEIGCENNYGFNSLYDHRVGVVRNEARATSIARGYLKGKNYRDIEPSRKPEKELLFYRVAKRASKIAITYGTNKSEKDFGLWLNK
tara:strand:+ start:847 stop:1185 length:339 start_codon:yes stop_codon:yes gene_type:complete